MELTSNNNNKLISAWTSDDIENVANSILVKYEGRDDKDLHEDVFKLRKLLQKVIEAKPLVKRLKVSYHTNGKDPIKLIFDNDPTIPIDHEHFVNAALIHVTDTHNGMNIIKYIY